MKHPVSLLIFFISLVACSAAMASTDADNDGIPDAMDQCPNTAQLKKLSPGFKFAAAVNPARLDTTTKAYPVDSKGCEFDDDNDGIVNSQDYCPDNQPHELVAGIAPNGCPRHSDYDGTPDYRDHCPDTPRGIKTDRYGCPIP